MLLLLLIGLGIGLFYWGRSVGEKSNGVPRSLDAYLAERNRQWAAFIKTYERHAVSDEQRALLARMLQDVAAQYGDDLVASGVTVAAETNAAAERQYTTVRPAMSPAGHDQKTQLDNAALLLYFGAFLFIASVGLFVAFGGMSGGLRTLVVCLVMLTMYGGGLWLVKRRPTLEQAGLTFVGIGLAVAPLIGLAAYTYLFDQQNGMQVWFITSVLCVALYGHALVALRRPLLSYLFLGTFLSLFESVVTMVDAPLYYYGWGMIVVGIIYGAVARWRGAWPIVKESTRVSAQVLLPVSLVVSLYLSAHEGLAQLGISLLLAALFYGIEAAFSKGSNRDIQAVAAHWSGVMGAGVLAYGLTDSVAVTAFTLLVINIGQSVVFAVKARQSSLWENALHVAAVTHGIGVLLALARPGVAVAAVSAGALFGFVVWRRQRHAWGYVYMFSFWMLLPLVFGQVFMRPGLRASLQVWALTAFWAAQLAVHVCCFGRIKDKQWPPIARVALVLSILLVLVASIFASPGLCLGIVSLIAAGVCVLMLYDRDKILPLLTGLIVAIPIVRALDSPNALVLCVGVGLLINIGLSLWRRREATRWFSVVLWLLLPLVIGNLPIGRHWSEIQYSWLFVGATAGLILSRMIATGALAVSARVPLVSYARSMSLSYVYGYGFAGVLAVLLALPSRDTELLAALSVGSILVLIVYASVWVEKQQRPFVAVPFLAQAMLWLGMHPMAEQPTVLAWYLVGTTSLAFATYSVLPQGVGTRSGAALTRSSYMRLGSVMTVFVAPLSVLFVERPVWPMAVGLMAAGFLLLHYVYGTNQEQRELAGGVTALGVLWLLGIFHVTAVQAYVHVIVLLFGLYTYWRHKRKETSTSDGYLVAMLLTATVPLALQAMGGASGGFYGWWLLLEQVFFMLLGMSIKKRFVTFWGLYVAVGAVLYQLRHLGWAALTVLAVFLICLAVYRIQRLAGRHDQHE